MSTRRGKPGKWLGIGLIAVGVIIFVVSLSGPGPGYYGHGMHGMYDRPYSRFGHHMMGNGSVWGGWMGHHGMPYPGMMSGMSIMPGPQAMRGLDLDEQQQQRIDALQEQVSEKRWKLLESLRAENRKLESLGLGDRIDPGAMTEQYARCAQLRRQIFELALEERQQVDEVLTDEQRNELRQWRRDNLTQ